MRPIVVTFVLLLSGCAGTASQTTSTSLQAAADPKGCCCLIIAGPPDDCRDGFTTDDCNQQGEFQGEAVRWTPGPCPRR